MIFDHSGLFLDRFESASNGSGIPFVKVTLGPSRIAIVPEATEARLDGPGSGHLQVCLFEFTELLREDFIEMLFVDQPVKFGACQTPISGFLEFFVLLTTHFIHSLIKVLANMKPIMHMVAELAEVMSARGNFSSTACLYASHMSTATPVTCCCCSVVSGPRACRGGDCSINALQAASVRSSTPSSTRPCCKSTRLLMYLWPLRNCFSSMPR